jgi:hypothetical protein
MESKQMLYVDIPSPDDLAVLASTRAANCVSIYLPTTPVTRKTTGDRIELKNFAKEAATRLEESGASRRDIVSLSEQLADLVEDADFWRFQARSLAIFATPDNAKTFRVPNALEPVLVVSDRFHLKPLLRAVTFPNVAYVLALAEGSVRLVQVFADLPAVAVKVHGMPKSASSAAGRATINDRSPRGRLHGSEGQKVLLRQFARKVDRALRELLSGGNIPLILAATQPLASIYRSVNTYPHLAEATIEVSPGQLTDSQLETRARIVLDGLYRDELAALGTLFANRENQGRATTDVAQAARAATFGAVAILLIDIDEITPGTVDDNDGMVTFSNRPDDAGYGVVDEIASRVMRSGGRVLGVRKEDIPGGKSLAAILRHPA